MTLVNRYVVKVSTTRVFDIASYQELNSFLTNRVDHSDLDRIEIIAIRDVEVEP